MADSIYLNARADRCAINGMGRGARVVSHDGIDYLLVGVYFAPNHNGMRDLFFILCQVPDQAGQAPMRSREQVGE